MADRGGHTAMTAESEWAARWLSLQVVTIFAKDKIFPNSKL